MKVRPLHDRLVVRRADDAEQRVGGIIIPDSAKEKPQQGTVVAAGHGKKTDAGKRIPLGLTTGDRVLFSTFAGQEVTLDGAPYLIMKIEEVLAVIEGPITQKRPVITGRTTKKTAMTTIKKSAAMKSKGRSMKNATRKPKKKR